MVKLWKTTIVIWADNEPDDMGLDQLARDASEGNSICESQTLEVVDDLSRVPREVLEFFNLAGRYRVSSCWEHLLYADKSCYIRFVWDTQTNKVMALQILPQPGTPYTPGSPKEREWWENELQETLGSNPDPTGDDDYADELPQWAKDNPWPGAAKP